MADLKLEIISKICCNKHLKSAIKFATNDREKHRVANLTQFYSILSSFQTTILDPPSWNAPFSKSNIEFAIGNPENP